MVKKFSIKKGTANYYGGLGGNNLHKLGVEGYYYRDKPGVKESDYGVFYETDNFYLNLKKWKLWQDSNTRDGKYFTLHYNYSNWTFGGELGKYEDKTYLYPYIQYKSYINYMYYQSITGKESKSFCAVDNNLKTHHIVLSQYKGYLTKYKKDITDFWWSVDLSKTDSNIGLTPQFTYRFNKKHTYKDLEFYYYLSGWYQFNSKESNCYYSPSKYDSTYVEIHPIYKRLELIGKFGYSVEGKSKLYSYGFNFNNKWLDFGCMKNYSYKQGFDSYWYEECNLKAGVEW